MNRAFGADWPAFKEMLAGLAAALPNRRFDVEELIAEADAVVARFTLEMRDPGGKTISVRGLTYYRLANGKIVEDDPIKTPELTQVLGALITPALALKGAHDEPRGHDAAPLRVDQCGRHRRVRRARRRRLR